MMTMMKSSSSCRRHDTRAVDGWVRAQSSFELFLCWMPPFGLMGAHHFYRGSLAWGFFYFFTFGTWAMHPAHWRAATHAVGCAGGMVLGWLADGFLLPSMARRMMDPNEYTPDGRHKPVWRMRNSRAVA
jgi:TM2 domain-containing membrane protein YozV